MMRIFVALMVLAVAAASQPAPGFSQTDEIVWRGSVEADDGVEIFGVNGEIRAVPSDDDQVHVEATLRGRRSGPETVRIQVVEHEGGVTVCAVYPTPEGARRENDCLPGGGSRNVQDNDVEVDFVVRMPAGVDLRAHTVNGDVDMEGLRGDAEGTTVNGDVSIETTGFVRAATTVNGGVLVEVPAGLDADFRASTVNGTIESDFPILLSGRVGPREMRGTIGDGGRELRVSTVNGNIRIRRR